VPSEPHALSLAVDPAALRPLITEVVRETLAAVEAARAALPEGRLAYSEAEAARLLGMLPHQLRDERLEGKIRASKVRGRRVRYQREDLLGYLARRRVNDD
jgi:hypothetical protein